jgi:hypothetical protein
LLRALDNGAFQHGAELAANCAPVIWPILLSITHYCFASHDNPWQPMALQCSRNRTWEAPLQDCNCSHSVVPCSRMAPSEQITHCRSSPATLLAIHMPQRGTERHREAHSHTHGIAHCSLHCISFQSRPRWSSALVDGTPMFRSSCPGSATIDFKPSLNAILAFGLVKG